MTERKLVEAIFSFYLFACLGVISNQIVTFLTFSSAFLTHIFQSQFFLQSDLHSVLLNFKFPLIVKTEKLNIYLL